jgi:hypothetical protein
MPDAENIAKVLYGPWSGHDETGGDPRHVVRGSLNVVFRRGEISRRPGRKKLASALGSGRRVTGIFQFVDRRGARQIVVTLDAPAGLLAGEQQIGILDEQDGSFDALTIPELYRSVHPGGFALAVNAAGVLIIADPEGRILAYDGSSLSGLQAFVGLDLLRGDAGAQGYLGAPPRARALALWRNKLIAGAAPESPATIAISSESSELAIVPADAPLGGFNVWPASANFDALTEEGDELLALTVLHDRLIPLTRGGAGQVDEDAISPILRMTEQRHGCYAARSVQSTGQRALYLSDGKIVSFNGVVAEPISAPVAKTLENVVNWRAAGGAVSAHLRTRNEYRLWVPCYGDERNELCIIYDYQNNAWRLAAGWYPWDTETRKAAANRFDVTAARPIRLETGEELLLTGDSAGNLWIEDVCEDDEGVVAPAYVELPDVASAGPERGTFRDFWILARNDGSFIQALALPDGRTAEEEISRVLDGATPTEYAVDTKRALLDGQLTFATATLAWPVAGGTVDLEWLKVGVVQKARVLRPVLLFPGASGGTIDTSPGAIRAISLGARPHGTPGLSRRIDA